MYSQKPHEAYRNNSVNTATSGELTLMLYNGCIKFIKQAKRNIEDTAFEAKNTNIQKAQKIIRELMVTLNPEMDLTKQMMPLYEFIMNCLQEANMKNDLDKLDEALELVQDFRDTWKQVILQNRKLAHAESAEV
ncbi:MAG TPA: flagellar export chaperone FliS [Candidatus Avamphibacillus intestinigallinarum]|nr:flagellar export chaperone FliS [Candidatus Avamphibacillus intestinigallinarum]